jgi:hypothetical protein
MVRKRDEEGIRKRRAKKNERKGQGKGSRENRKRDRETVVKRKKLLRKKKGKPL